MALMQEVAMFKQRVRDLYRKSSHGDDDRDLFAELNRIELNSSSACGLIHIFHNGNGALVDLAIDAAAFDRYDAEGLGQAICSTMQSGETVIRDVLTSVRVGNTTGKVVL